VVAVQCQQVGRFGGFFRAFGRGSHRTISILKANLRGTILLISGESIFFGKELIEFRQKSGNSLTIGFLIDLLALLSNLSLNFFVCFERHNSPYLPIP